MRLRLGRPLAGAMAAAAFLAGCTNLPSAQSGGVVGHDFPLSAFAQFQLKQTSIYDVETALGAPMLQKSTTGIANPGLKGIAQGARFSSLMLTYFYQPAGFGAQVRNRPGKAAVLVFFDSHLISYGYASRLAGEGPQPLNQALLTNLQQGTTTRAQVLAMFGPPSSEVLHAFGKKESTDVGNVDVGYSWYIKDAASVQTRVLTLSFDPSDHLLTYNLQDNSAPQNGATLPVMQAPPG